MESAIDSVDVLGWLASWRLLLADDVAERRIVVSRRVACWRWQWAECAVFLRFKLQSKNTASITYQQQHTARISGMHQLASAALAMVVGVVGPRPPLLCLLLSTSRRPYRQPFNCARVQPAPVWAPHHTRAIVHVHGSCWCVYPDSVGPKIGLNTRKLAGRQSARDAGPPLSSEVASCNTVLTSAVLVLWRCCWHGGRCYLLLAGNWLARLRPV